MQTTRARCPNAFSTIYLTLAAALLALAMVQAIHKHSLSTATAYLYAAALAAFNAALPSILGRPTGLPSLLRWLPRLALAASSVWILLIAVSHRVDGWDEGAYVLSGLALRGHPVPYASHRPPITSWLAAAFGDLHFLVNPILLTLLLLSVYRWARAIGGEAVAAASVIVVLSQNLLLEASVDLLTELPAALLLTAGFHLLALQRHIPASLLLSLSVFARWNLAPILPVVFLFALAKRQKRVLISLCLCTLTILTIWHITTARVSGVNPFVAVYQNFLTVRNYVSDPSEVVNVFTRAEFYLSNFFFLTPAVALGVVVSLCCASCRPLTARHRVELLVIPISLVAYALTMLNLGAHYARFMTPVIPCAVLSTLSGIKAFLEDCGLPGAIKIKIFATLVFVTAAWGAWPFYSLVLVRAAIGRPPIFEEKTRQVLRQIPRETRVCALAVHPLSRANGHPAMVEVRHEILFPTAGRDFTGAPIEQSFTEESIKELAEACGAGSFLLSPAQEAAKFSTAQQLYSDGTWTLLRNP
jgi:hypothetical protein